MVGAGAGGRHQRSVSVEVCGSVGIFGQAFVVEVAVFWVPRKVSISTMTKSVAVVVAVMVVLYSTD